MKTPNLSVPPRQKSTPRRTGVFEGWDWPTFAVLAGCITLFSIALALPAGWGVVRWIMLVFALTLHSSLSHEMLHWTTGLRSQAATALGIIQPGLFVPYLRFKALHLAHHRDSYLTDPYDDPETNYLDPKVWNEFSRWQRGLLRFNNTLLGRMSVGPIIGMAAFVCADWAAIRAGAREILVHWLVHVPGVVLTLWAVSLSSVSVWVYLSVCYAALSILRIRTFLEHRAHERASGRTVIIEDRGPLAFLFLNNNFHAVHHIHPKVPWHRLPALYRSKKDDFLTRNQGYVYRSYAQVFAAHFLRAKDPVAHPLWQARQEREEVPETTRETLEA